MNWKELQHEARALEEQCLRDRRWLHAHAETGFDLRETFDYVRAQLESIGCAPQKCGRHGIVATLGKPGRTFLLRADMDALPIREESGEVFACGNGNMHACGHDMHTAMLLTAARILKKHESELNGTVKLMFQPAEELLHGAADMIEGGILENPKVDAAMMFHAMTGHPMQPGTMILSAPGVSAPAAATFEIRVTGKGTHGAMPHAGVDPINAAAHIVTALQAINTRELAMSEPAAVTIGAFLSGDAANVIPDSAVLRGSLRACDDGVMEKLRTRLAEISAGTAQVFRAKAEVEFTSGCPTLINNAELCASVERILAPLAAEGLFVNAAQIAGSSVSRSSGSEDFAAVSHCVPSVMLAIAAGSPEDGYTFPLHHPKVRFDERALTTGAAVHAFVAMQWLAERD